MNCRPGDIAVIVRGNNLGALLLVIEPGDEPGDWACQALTSVRDTDGRRHPPGTIGDCQDDRMRPLRDSGPDAVDETLRPYRLPEVA